MDALDELYPAVLTTMLRSIQPLQFLLTLLAGWINRRQLETIALSRLYARTLRPGLALIDRQAAVDHPLRRAFDNLDKHLDRFCQQEKLAA